jgi:hypothetical protein
MRSVEEKGIRGTGQNRFIQYQLQMKDMDNPEDLEGVTVYLPNRLSAYFVRINDWKPIAIADCPTYIKDSGTNP